MTRARAAIRLTGEARFPPQTTSPWDTSPIIIDSGRTKEPKPTHARTATTCRPAGANQRAAENGAKQ